MAPAAGAVLALLVAVAVYTRFGFGDALRRDEAIYAYGGQQLTDGVAPYASIFDPKTPAATALAALGVAVGRALGTSDGAGDVHAMRIVFFVFACLTVVAIYLLALRLWRSPYAALLAAVVFVAFRGFAIDALGGPNAKTPGIFFAVLAMWLLAGRRWFWGGLAAALAFLVWQPLVFFVAAALAAAPLASEPGRRRRAFAGAAAGAAVPMAVTVVAFALAGRLGEAMEAAVRFPVEGLRRKPETIVQHLNDMHRVIVGGYGWSAYLLVAGVIALGALAIARIAGARRDLRSLASDPLVIVVFGTAVPLFVLSLNDFQGYPDVYPALPYGALGLGGAAALLLARGGGVAVAGCVVATAAVAVGAWVALSNWTPVLPGTLAEQRASAQTIRRVLPPDQALFALGDPTPLVLTRRRNPDRFIYLGSGVARWKVLATPQGFRGWQREILAARPGMVMLRGWRGPCERAMWAWLGTQFQLVSVGRWEAFVSRAVRERARREGVGLPPRPSAPPPGRRKCVAATAGRAGPPRGSPRPHSSVA